jgi:hypothetical protein
MTATLPKLLGISGIATAGLALGFYGYEVALPYRLSLEQEEMLSRLAPMQFCASLLAFLLGLVALVAGRRLTSSGPLYAKIALVAGASALLLGILTPHVHSVSRGPTVSASPNLSLQATPDCVSLLIVAQVRGAPDGCNPPA